MMESTVAILGAFLLHPMTRLLKFERSIELGNTRISMTIGHYDVVERKTHTRADSVRASAIGELLWQHLRFVDREMQDVPIAKHHGPLNIELAQKAEPQLQRLMEFLEHERMRRFFYSNDLIAREPILHIDLAINAYEASPHYACRRNVNFFGDDVTDRWLDATQALLER